MSYEHALIYVQILLAVLLFALGIPVLLVEPSVEYRIRHILHKHLPFRVITSLLSTTVIVVIGLLFVPAPKDGSQPAHLRQVAASERVGSANVEATTRTSGFSRVSLTVDDAIRIVTAALILGFALIWLRMTREDIAAALVRRVRNGLVKAFRRRGYYADDDLRDLLSIGVHASAGHEKQVVIQAVAHVEQVIQRSPQYSGAELSSLIHGFLEVVTQERQGDESNVIDCLEELRTIWSRLEERGLQKESDGIATVEVACLLGEFAVTIGSDAAAIQALSVVENMPELPFRVGRLAVATVRFRVAVMCLNQLEAIAERNGTVPKELVALIAHFTGSGESARRRASQAAKLLTGEMIDRVAAAYYDIGEFATADLIRLLRPPRSNRVLRQVALGVGLVLAALLAQSRRT